MRAVQRNTRATVLVVPAAPPASSAHALQTVAPDPPAPTPTPIPLSSLPISAVDVAFITLPAGGKISFDGNGRRIAPGGGAPADIVVEGLAIAPLFLSSVKSNYAANEYTSIHILARDRLEQLMNKPFNDAALSVGVHANDQAPMLPDPATGVPPASGGVLNPFTITYQVLQYQIAGLDTASTPANAAFAPTRITAAGQPFDYKRVDVTVRTSSVSGILGLNSHVARVSGIVGNPSPQGNLSTVDGCALGSEAVCP